MSWIIPEKGIVDLLKAVQLLVSRGVKVHFALVGEGDYTEQYRTLAAEMGVADVVSWIGVAQDPFAEGVYAAADIVCQVSRWEEVSGGRSPKRWRIASL